MANKVNNWQELLKLANEDLKKYGVEINVLLVDDTGDYDLHIFYPDGTTDIFAENYYEDELGELVNDAWAHARAKAKAKNMAKISKSTWGETWSVEERIGSTLFCTNHDTLAEAIAYCIGSNLSFTII